MENEARKEKKRFGAIFNTLRFQILAIMLLCYLIPALLLLIQAVAAVFGFTLDLGELGDKLLTVVNTVFAVLAILGIVTDPTTEGMADSNLAMTDEVPKKKT